MYSIVWTTLCTMENEEIGLLHWSFLSDLKLVLLISKMVKLILLDYLTGMLAELNNNGCECGFLNYKMLFCHMYFKFFLIIKCYSTWRFSILTLVCTWIKLPRPLSCLEGGAWRAGKSFQKEEATASERLQWLVGASWWAGLQTELKTGFHEMLWKWPGPKEWPSEGKW